MSDRRTRTGALFLAAAAAALAFSGAGCGYVGPALAVLVDARNDGSSGATPLPLNANTTVAIVEVPRIDLTRETQPVIVTVTDPESDPVALELEYRDDGASATAFLPATLARVRLGALDGEIVFEGPAAQTSDLPSSPTGTVYVLEWLWQQDLGANPHTQIALRLGVVGTEGLTGGVSFTSENQTIGNEKPVVSGVTISGSSDVIFVSFQVSDSTSDPCVLEVVFRVAGESAVALVPVEPQDFVAVATAPAATPLTASFAWSSRDPGQVGARRADVTIEIVARDTGGLASDLALSGLFQVNNNRPPLAAVDPPARAVTGTATIVYRLVDSESDPVTVTARFEREDGTQMGIAQRAGTAGEGTEGLAASPDGVAHVFVWSYAGDLLTGNAAARVRFRIEPAEAGSTPGESALIVGNDAPGAAFTSVPAPVTGDAPVGVSLTDSTQDLFALEVAYSTDGGATFSAASGGPVLGLAPGAATFTWQSAADLPGADGTPVVLRLRAIDGFQGGESAYVTTTAVVDNVGNRAPSAAVATPARTPGGPVTVAYTLSDPDFDSIAAAIEVAIDGGAFVTATAAAGSPGTTNLPAAPSGTAYTFLWDAPAQAGAGGASARVRVRPIDGAGAGAEALSGPFFVGNDAPAIAFASAFPGVQRGFVEVGLTLLDFEGDPAAAALAYSTNGGQDFTPAATAGTTAGLATRGPGGAGPAQHVIFWRSDLDLPGVSPTAVVLRLTSDDGLPGGAAGAPATASATIRNDAGRPPAASVGAPARSVDGLVTVPYALVDPDTASVSIAVEFSLDGVSFTAAQDGPGGDGRTGLGASAAGVAHGYVWDAGSQIGLGARNGIVFRIAPDDGLGGSVGRSPPFRYGNDAPTVTAVTVLGIPLQPVIRFTISDSSADLCALDAAYRAAGDADFTPIPAGRIAAGSVADFTAPEGGVTLDFAWDARGQLGTGVLEDVEVRLIPGDPFVTGTAIVSATFTAGDAGGGGGPAPVVITDKEPSVGPVEGGIVVRFFGDGFVAGSTVLLFGANPSPLVTVRSDGVLDAVVPPGPRGDVIGTLTAPGGSAMFGFTYVDGIEFAAPTSTASESGGPVAVEVRLGADPASPLPSTVSAVVLASGGTAREGIDFPALAVTVEFAAGTTGPQTQMVLIPLANDVQREATETLVLGLDQLDAPGAVVLGARASHTISILDDGDGGIVFFEATPARVQVGAIADLSFAHDAPLGTTLTLDPGAIDVTGLGGKGVIPFPVDPGLPDPRAGYRVGLELPSGGATIEIEAARLDGVARWDDVATFGDGGYVTAGTARGGAVVGRDRPGATTLPPTTVANRTWRVVARWSADGSLIWVATGEMVDPSGSDVDPILRLAALEDGRVLLAGRFTRDNRFYDAGSLGVGGTLLVYSGPAGSSFNPDLFALSLDPAGAVEWARVAVGTGSDEAHAVAAFPDGTAVVGGIFGGTVTFGAGEAGATTLAAGGTSERDAFVARYAPDGSLIWVRQIGFGSAGEDVVAVAALPDGGFLATGFAEDGTRFGGSTPPFDALGRQDVFVARFQSDGAPVYVKRVGGGATNDITADMGKAIAALPDGSAYITGFYRATPSAGATFGPLAATVTTLQTGFQAIFVARTDAAGDVVWARSAAERPETNLTFPEGRGAIALPDGSAVITGVIERPSPFGAGEPTEVTLVPPQDLGAFEEDLFLARYLPDGRLSWAVRAGADESDEARAVAALAGGRMMVVGLARGAPADAGAPVRFGEGDETEIALEPLGFGSGPTATEGYVAVWRPLSYAIAEVRPEGHAWALIPQQLAGTSIGLGAAAVGSGESIVTGRFSSAATFGPGEAAAATLTSVGGDDGFVARYGPGGGLVWAAALECTASLDEVVAAAADPAGGAYVGGRFGGAGAGENLAVIGRPGAGRALLSSVGGIDALLARLGPDGGALWAERMGGSGPDFAVDVATLPGGAGALVTGVLQSASATFGRGGAAVTLLADAGSLSQAFVARYDAAGGLVYARQASGAAAQPGSSAAAQCVAAFPDGSALFGGGLNGTITVGFGTTMTATLTGALDGLVAKLDPAGNLVYAVKIGGSGNEVIFDAVALPDGRAIVAGQFSGTVTFAPGIVRSTITGNPLDPTDAFVARLDPAGVVEWVATAGGTGQELAAGLALLPDGGVLATGAFSSSTASFDGVPLGLARGGVDAFLARYRPDGTLAYVKAVGGDINDLGRTIAALDPDGSALVVGFLGNGEGVFGKDEANETTVGTVGLSRAFAAKVFPYED